MSLARVPVTGDEIEIVVATFYGRFRANSEIGPIFIDSLTLEFEIWRAHEAKIVRFWRNALLREPVYDGNPMMIHAGISAVSREHFSVWLGIFDQVLAENVHPEAARLWSALAHRVACL